MPAISALNLIPGQIYRIVSNDEGLIFHFIRRFDQLNAYNHPIFSLPTNPADTMGFNPLLNEFYTLDDQDAPPETGFNNSDYNYYYNTSDTNNQSNQSNQNEQNDENAQNEPVNQSYANFSKVGPSGRYKKSRKHRKNRKSRKSRKTRKNRNNRKTRNTRRR